MREYRFSVTRVLPYKDRIVDTILNPFPTDLIFKIFEYTRSTDKNVKNRLYAFLRSV